MGDGERPRPEEGVRRGVGHDREEAVGVVVVRGEAAGRAGQLDPEGRVLAVVAAEERADGGHRERRVREPPFQPGVALDPLDDRGVEAGAEMEQELAAVAHPEADPPERPALERVEHLCRPRGRGGCGTPGCGRRRSSSHRGAAPAPSPTPARPSAASLSVPSPPSTTTASMPSRAAARGEPGGVTPAIGLGHLEPVPLAERPLDLHTPAGRHRRRGRVHDQEQAHGWAGYAGRPGPAGPGPSGREGSVLRSRRGPTDPNRRRARGADGRDRRVPGVPAPGRVARAGRGGEAGGLPRRGVLGPTGPGLRRSAARAC